MLGAPMKQTNKADKIAISMKSTCERLGLRRTEFANLLRVNSIGERTVRAGKKESTSLQKRKLTLYILSKPNCNN
jgi:hypothetical protein